MTRARLTRPRLLGTISVAALVAAVAVLVSLMIDVTQGESGRQLILTGPRDLWRALTSGGSIESEILVRFRLPRVLAGLTIGAGLAAAGCAFQSVLRNPLAEPFILGVSSGSALAAVLAIRLGLDQTFLGQGGVGSAALIGAALAVLFVWRLGRVGSSLPPATLLLAGVALAQLCAAATMVVQYTANFSEAYRIVRWMMGGLDGILMEQIGGVAVAVGVGLAVLLWLARDLNAISAGSEAAASVGVDADRVTAIVFAVSSLIVGAGIAVAGPIGFVGLIVPHAMRALVGPDHRVLLPVSMLVGGALLVACDSCARLLLYPAELPTGVMTALLGAPLFLVLLMREKRRGRLWAV